MSSNFSFLPPAFKDLAEASRKAEEHIMGDPRAACFHARFALEAAVRWLYRYDTSLRMPYDSSLGAMIHDPGFRNLLPEAVFQKARVIQQVGNQAVHESRPIRQLDAMQVVKELHHFCYWLTRTYAPDASREGAAWSDARVPQPVTTAALVPRKELEALEKQLEEQAKEALQRQQEKDALDSELQLLRAHLAEAKAAAEKKPDTHDYSEAQTRHYLIDLELKRAGWPLDQKRDKEFEVTGMPNQAGKGYVDDVLWGDDGKPLGIVESKKTTVDARVGQQQAKLYADCLEAMYDQRPVIFYTNGYETWIWDDTAYPPRRVSGFYKKEELARLILRRGTRKHFSTVSINGVIVERYYAKRAITSICEHFTKKQRKALLVMATGTGKTRVAIALVDVLQRANWAKRILFLADRVALVNQAGNAFKAHLPDSSPVNLVTEKNTEGRVYVCTYPTMMGLIDETDGGTARFGIGHFDLVIIDEAHRSVYQRYREIFRYFDSLLVGLTATPRDQVDKNTYELFDLEQGVPTDAYELELAVSDGFLVPPQVRQVDLKFPREGIHYDELSDEEKAEWESLDWGDGEGNGGAPTDVHASAINNWLFNTDTVDKVLQHLMAEGLKVEGGDRLGKTIIFARNHDHAKFIEERFNFHYPHYAGHFARIIDHYAKYPQSLIDDFSQKDKAPHIAISVDMLDTGIDVPEIVNLVFFKPVYSKIKFWQMIGRGTRLCKNLFGPDQDKEHFRIFDFCFNFDFFRENPNGIEGSGGEALGTRIFKSRVQLLAAVQKTPGLEPSGGLRAALASTLHGEVSGMNPDNFMVRAHLQHVERFKNQASWESLSDSDIHEIEHHVAGLPSQIETDEIEARFFDLSPLRMQIALVEKDAGTFESNRKKVIEIAASLEEKDAIPAVKQQLEYPANLHLIFMPLFERYLGIDYSGAQTPTSSLDGLRVCEATSEQLPTEIPPPPGPRKYWTRRGLAEWLAAELRNGPPTLVGIDHAFSFPMRYYEAHHLPPDWHEFLDDFRHHWPTDEDLMYVDFIRGGRYGNGIERMGNSRWRRLTEERSRTAKSVFHFDVQGSVAKSTHAGLPWLRYLRQQLGSHLHFWPFDGWVTPPGRSVIAEVYPALWSRSFPMEGRNSHQHDAYSVARWLQETDDAGTLPDYFQPHLQPAERTVALVEGWILGLR